MDVTAGSAESYACLNQVERDLVARQKAQLNGTVLNAGSPAPSLGLYNQAATREQYGGNFGHSAVPLRPPPPVFANPLLPPVPR